MNNHEDYELDNLIAKPRVKGKHIKFEIKEENLWWIFFKISINKRYLKQ